MNVFELNAFEDINLVYPNAKSKSLNDLPDAKDISFIKNDLVRFSGTSIHYLGLNRQYIPTNITELQKISPSIIDQNS
jgi:hypothetical protein